MDRESDMAWYCRSNPEADRWLALLLQEIRRNGLLYGSLTNEQRGELFQRAKRAFDAGETAIPTQTAPLETTSYTPEMLDQIFGRYDRIE